LVPPGHEPKYTTDDQRSRNGGTRQQGDGKGEREKVCVASEWGVVVAEGEENTLGCEREKREQRKT